MSALFLSIALKPFFALLFFVPAAYGAHWVRNRMRPGKLKSLLLTRIS